MAKNLDSNLKESILQRKKTTKKGGSVLKKYNVGPANIDNLEESASSDDEDIIVRVVDESVIKHQ